MNRELTQHKLLQLIMSALEGDTMLVARVDLREPGHVRFTWWRTRFRVNAATLTVHHVDGDQMRQDEAALLLERLLRATSERLAAVESELATLVADAVKAKVAAGGVG